MLRELRLRQPAQFPVREQVVLEQRAPLGFVVVERGARLVATGVVDQQMQFIAEVVQPVEQFGALLGIGDVGGEGDQLGLREIVLQFEPRGLQCSAVAGDHAQRGAEAEQLAADGQADAGAGTGDQGGVGVEAPASVAHSRVTGRVVAQHSREAQSSRCTPCRSRFSGDRRANGRR
jgi:hypothetical protein